MFIPVPSRLVLHEMEKMAVHPVGIQIMAPKAELCPEKLFQVKSPSANIIKQEMLSMGCECVTVKGAINCSVPVGDVLLLGNKNQYRHLVEKLETMRAWFGFAEVIADLKAYLDETPLVTTLADGRQLTYEKMRVMGILNVTPDSFYAGSRVIQEETLLHTAGKMLEDGADILDIGGESTRPWGYTLLSDEEEIARVVPMIEAVKANFDIPISLVTYNSGVAEAGIRAGADLINDIWGLKYDNHMAKVIAKSGLPCCLMHNRKEADYRDFMQDVAADLADTIHLAEAAGIADEKIILDPGVGFGKTYENNLEIINCLEELNMFGYPLLLGCSRKSVIGLTLDLPVTERVEGTLVTTMFGVQKGCMFVRVHDVKENVRTIKMCEAILNSSN